MDKKILRQDYLQKRLGYAFEVRLSWDQKIHDSVIDRIGNHKVIALYAAFRNEVDTYAIMETLFWEQDLLVCLPRIHDGEMTFHPVKSFDELKQNSMGILEPTALEVIPKTAIDMMIVPMLGFNRWGYRLGYGGGYYDRYLQNQQIVTLGLAYDFQEIKADFQEAFDIPCDAIITQKEIINGHQTKD